MRLRFLALLFAISQSLQAQAPPAQRRVIAATAFDFIRVKSLPDLAAADRDSVLLELGYGFADDSLPATTRDSLGRALNVRTSAFRFAQCSTGGSRADQLRRAHCASGLARFYIEFSGMTVSADSARVALSVFELSVAPRRNTNPLRALGVGIAHILGRSDRVFTTSLQEFTVLLARESSGWRVVAANKT